MLALVVGLVFVSARDSEDAQVPPVTSAPETIDEQPTPRQILELLRPDPIDGKDSWRLPVVVTPQSGVVDGQTVTAIGRGFAPSERVGVVMCTSEAGVEGVAACDLGTLASPYEHVTYANAGPDGGVIADVTAAPDDHDAAHAVRSIADRAAERCLVAIGAVSDYDRSGGSFVDFADAPPFPEPTLVVDPPGPYTDGQPVTVVGAGLLATRQIQVLQCLGLRCVAAGRRSHRRRRDVRRRGRRRGVVRRRGGRRGVRAQPSASWRSPACGLDEATSAPMPPPVALGPIAPVEPALPPSTPPAACPQLLRRLDPAERDQLSSESVRGRP